MQLLVSVASAADASAAVEGGAAFIDAKDPSAGPLGAVNSNTFTEICRAVGGRRAVTAALGDAADEDAIETAARTFANAGALLVKVGFAGIARIARADALLAAAMRGIRHASERRCGVVAVAYADAHAVAALPPAGILTIAVRNGAAGVLLDTADKAGPGLRDMMPRHAIAAWVADAHANGLLVALAGKLRLADLSFARDCGADVAGVRGAACDWGRTGRISVERVRQLRAACDRGNGQPDEDRADSSAALSSAATMTARTFAGSTRGK